MRKLFLSVVLLVMSVVATHAAVSIGHVENSTVGQFLDSTGTVPTVGGVAIGIFTSTEPSSFTGFTSYSDLVAAGFMDVRNMPGASFGSVDWDFPGSPNAASGTVSNIPTSSLPTGAQIYVFGFNVGTFATGFAGATEWAVVKDNANTGPADLGSKSILLNSAVGGAEVLIGADNGVSVNMAAFTAAPEPSRLLLLGFGALGLLMRRRRQA